METLKIYLSPRTLRLDALLSWEVQTSSKDNVLASVSYGYDSSGRVIDSSTYPFSLNINMNYYGSITSATIDQDGKSSASGSLYLDRVLAHEFTHAVMAANISWFDKLPLFIVEGMAELTHGIDDARKSSINTLASNSTALAAAVNMSTTKYTSDHAYAAGYMFLRYLAKQAYDTANIYVYGSEGNDNKKTKKTINNQVSNKIIMALSGNDSIVNSGDDVTIIGGAGNDSINLQGSRQVVQYANGDGKDIIINFTAVDTIHLTDATLSGAALKKNNVILKVGKGTITLAGVKGQVVNIIDKDGNASSNIYGNGTVTMRGTDNSETITAWGKADSIYAMAGDDTLIGGKGADTLTGGDGYNVFYYNNGDGNDLITDFKADSDTIVIASGAISKASTLKNSPNDISFKVGKGSIRLSNAIGQKIKIIDAAGNTTKQQFGVSKITVLDGDGATINAGVDALVETIDASARSEDLYLIGNAKANLFLSGSGNSTITTGKGKDTVDYTGGSLSITDYASGSDAIRFHTDILSAKYSGDNLIFTTQLGTVTLSGAMKKNKPQKVTIIDKDGITYSQIYGSPTLTVANSDGDTLSAESNTEVTVINAAKRSKPVYLIGNALNNTIKGGSKADTIEALSGDDFMSGGNGNDLFIYSAGHDTIADYSVAKNNMDAISLSGALEIENYFVHGKNVVLSFKDHSTLSSSLTIINGKDKNITINGQGTVYNDYYEKIFSKTNSASSYTADSLVVTINAASNTSAINITANDKDNTIKGSKYADTLSGGYGNDSITTGKGRDLVIFSGGNDVITDYSPGSDSISLGADIQSASYSGNDLIFKADDNNSLTILNAKTNKGKEIKITVVDNGVTTSQCYGTNSLTIAASDGNTIDLSKAMNAIVTSVDASSRKPNEKNAPIQITCESSLFAGTRQISSIFNDFRVRQRQQPVIQCTRT